MIIKLYAGSEKVKMGLLCQECCKPIGTKPCVLIVSKKGVFVWVCSDCVTVKNYCDGAFPCSK